MTLCSVVIPRDHKGGRVEVPLPPLHLSKCPRGIVTTYTTNFTISLESTGGARPGLVIREKESF